VRRNEWISSEVNARTVYMEARWREVKMGFLDLLRGKPDVRNLRERGDVDGLIRALSKDVGTWRAVEVRRQAAEALGGFRDQKAVTALIKALDDLAWQVRDEAVRSLGRINDPSSVGILLEMVRSHQSLDAVRSLGAMGGPDSVQALKIALEDSSEDVHREAAKALETIAEKSKDPSIRADISATLKKAERNRSDEQYRKSRIFERLKSAPPYRVTFALYQLKEVNWPNVCCLCLGPVEIRVRVAGIEDEYMRGKLMHHITSVEGAPYCKFCSEMDKFHTAVEIELRGGRVTFVFKNPEYGMMFESANRVLGG